MAHYGAEGKGHNDRIVRVTDHWDEVWDEVDW